MQILQGKFDEQCLHLQSGPSQGGGRSANPISTRGDTLSPPSTTCPPPDFWPLLHAWQVHGQFKALKRIHSFWTNLNHLVHVVLPPPSCFWWPFVLKMQSLAHKWGDVWHAKPIKMSQNAAASGKGEHCAQPKLSSPMMVGAGATARRY